MAEEAAADVDPVVHHRAGLSEVHDHRGACRHGACLDACRDHPLDVAGEDHPHHHLHLRVLRVEARRGHLDVIGLVIGSEVGAWVKSPG